MFDWFGVCMWIMMIVLVLLLVFLLVMGGYAIYDGCTKVEVETYTVGCEVSQIAYAEKASGKSSSRAEYKMGVRNDDFAATFEINETQFAKYVVGDVVEVKVTVWEHHDGTLTETYTLIG